jgi:hypothetical protein
MGKKRKVGHKENEYEIDPVPKHLVVAHLQNQEKRLIIVLENAQLETVKVRNILRLVRRRWNRELTCVHCVTYCHSAFDFRWEILFSY